MTILMQDYTTKRTLELKDNEQTKKRILENSGWKEVTAEEAAKAQEAVKAQARRADGRVFTADETRTAVGHQVIATEGNDMAKPQHDTEPNVTGEGETALERAADASAATGVYINPLGKDGIPDPVQVAEQAQAAEDSKPEEAFNRDIPRDAEPDTEVKAITSGPGDEPKAKVVEAQDADRVAHSHTADKHAVYVPGADTAVPFHKMTSDDLADARAVRDEVRTVEVTDADKESLDALNTEPLHEVEVFPDAVDDKRKATNKKSGKGDTKAHTWQGNLPEREEDSMIDPATKKGSKGNKDE